MVEFKNPVAVAEPNGYSHAAVNDLGTYRMVILSGQVPLDKNGKLVGGGRLTKTTEQVFLNIKNILADLGGTMDDLVKTGVFMTDVSQVQTFREVRSRFITSVTPPANTLLHVSSLFTREVLIEIEATAIIPNR